MRTWFALALGLCCFLITACGGSSTGGGSGSSKPQDLIVGKWETVDAPVVTEEFTKDGKSIRKTRTCKYTLADDGTLEYKEDDGKTFAKYKAAVTNDALTLTGGDGDVTKYKRVK